MPTLYLVSIPLGDPDDISMRALRILGDVSAIAADDMDAARSLLARYEIATAIVEYADTMDRLVTGDVALISTRATPGVGIGQEVVREAIARGVKVEPLPGADAAITALVLSGLATDMFAYVGALPEDLSQWANEQATMIFTTADMKAGLKRLMDAFGDRRVCIVREEQSSEAMYRGMASAASGDLNLQGEVVLVVEGAPEQVAEVWDEGRVRAELRERLAAGEPLKLAAKTVANVAGWDRRTVYKIGIELKELFD